MQTTYVKCLQNENHLTTYASKWSTNVELKKNKSWNSFSPIFPLMLILLSIQHIQILHKWFMFVFKMIWYSPRIYSNLMKSNSRLISNVLLIGRIYDKESFISKSKKWFHLLIWKTCFIHTWALAPYMLEFSLKYYTRNIGHIGKFAGYNK